MSKNLRALTAIVLSQLLIEWMGFFLGIKLAKTQGVEYINLTRDGKAALDFVQQQFEK